MFTVRLPATLAARVRQRARESGSTISDLVVQALTEFLARVSEVPAVGERPGGRETQFVFDRHAATDVSVAHAILVPQRRARPRRSPRWSARPARPGNQPAQLDRLPGRPARRPRGLPRPRCRPGRLPHPTARQGRNRHRRRTPPSAEAAGQGRPHRPEMITIRHRIPLRERITSDSNHTENTDTEGEHPRHCPVRWGLPLAAARQYLPVGAGRALRPAMASGDGHERTTASAQEQGTRQLADRPATVMTSFSWCSVNATMPRRCARRRRPCSPRWDCGWHQRRPTWSTSMRASRSSASTSAG